jgi:hypothetical protein
MLHAFKLWLTRLGCPAFGPAQRGAAPGAGVAQLSPDRLRGELAAFSSAPFASLCQTHRQAQPLQTEAGNAKKPLETAIPGVLRIRPAPIDSVLGPVRFSRARTPLPVSSVLCASPPRSDLCPLSSGLSFQRFRFQLFPPPPHAELC